MLSLSQDQKVFFSSEVVNFSVHAGQQQAEYKRGGGGGRGLFLFKELHRSRAATREENFLSEGERGGAPEMWAGLSLLLALCLLHGGGAESEGGGPRCQPPAAWKIGEASKLDGLHKKLQGQGLTDVAFMVVNHQEERAQRLHPLLQERLSQDIALYKQHKDHLDVWKILNGEKDDFFIYDRCGRLTHHLSLPYNIIGHGHVERAIREAYCNRVCGECSFESADTPAECQRTDEAQPETDVAEAGREEHQHQHPHHSRHGHHGDNHGLRPRGFGHGHDRRHGHHHRHHHDGGQTQQGVGLQEHQHHLQQAVQFEQIGQEVVGAPPRP
ncbi:hypothetical protein OJAV_G00088000 [Oryzias javanicus]|uniref:Selenoprotein P N-terminal domain-containing protein n=1 Tax=Oryzias javanicus TaxID=123683 RepID=A0A437CZL1_ORYJA|nr:hypothetical protein OJAV_G00088000 [Oryzias javanicus]